MLHEDNLIWIDLEMTGLDPDRDSILEIATIVTDKDLNVLAEGPEFALRHSLGRLEAMDDWNRNQHRKSGLWQRVLESRIDLILTLGPVHAPRVALLGADPASMTPEGLWPSDHAGVAAQVVIMRQPPRRGRSGL